MLNEQLGAWKTELQHLVKQGQWRGALGVVEQMAAALPGDATILHKRAQIYIRLGQLEAARADLQRALELRTDYAGARDTLAQVEEAIASQPATEQPTAESATAATATTDDGLNEPLPELDLSGIASGDAGDLAEPPPEPATSTAAASENAVRAMRPESVYGSSVAGPTPAAECGQAIREVEAQVPSAPPDLKEPEPVREPELVSGADRFCEASAPATPPADHRSASAPPSEVADEQRYPWEVPGELESRVQGFLEKGLGYGYNGGATCTINSVLRQETKDKAVYAAKLNVHDELVWASEADEEPGFLVALIMALPEPLRLLFSPLLWALRAFDGLWALVVVAVMAIVAIAVVVMLWFIVIPAAVVLVAAAWVYEYLQRKHLAAVAARIRANPDSAYAVKKMHKLSSIHPRIWRRGDIVQVIRADARFKLVKTRSQVILVMHQPHPPGPGGIYITKLIGLTWSRWFKPCRRLYVMSMHKAEHADDAAQRISQAIGVPITAARYSMGALKVDAK